MSGTYRRFDADDNYTDVRSQRRDSRSRRQQRQLRVNEVQVQVNEDESSIFINPSVQPNTVDRILGR